MMAKNMFSFKKNIANMVTVSNAVFGIASIFFTILGNYSYAAILIFMAIALDILDGEIARGLNITSELGSQLDSLSDLVTFGIATAVLAFVFIFKTSILGAVVSAILVLCGIYRLARFNVVKKQKTFTGLPIPA
ncbi:MAG: CDP-diacylglycerol--serine O-phosphatidyltransferase, partial [Candidatus Aenigmarchaeota archaeon]|nr:CDP-diacylglycerol--serine O-phosphatidyltransferase [Candidatus Aenigmarchaeota archaeon]